MAAFTYNGQTIQYNYTGGVQTVSMMPGQYKLEVWGGEGGNGSWYGGYATGVIKIKSNCTFYIYCGGAGSSPSSYGVISGGYNGGGNGSSYNKSSKCGSGGGATDIRINSTSLYARVIVAGGGGGSHDSSYHGGAGGGSSGQDGTGTTYTSSKYGSYERYGHGGTQTGGGQGGWCVSSVTSSSYEWRSDSGSFGYGGNGHTGSSSSQYLNTCGGGGGWYGGGGGGCNATSSAGTCAGAGGGSGYVLTSSSYKPSGYLLNSDYYLTSTSMSTDVNNGHGYAKITCIQLYGVHVVAGTGIESVSSDYVSGTTQSGDTVTITATLKPGYHFVNWTGTQEITEQTYSFIYLGEQSYTFTANAAPDINAKYTVSYYIMNDDNETYSLYITKSYTGETDATVTAPLLSINLYDTPPSQTVTIKRDSISNVDYYYPKTKYTLNVASGTGTLHLPSVNGSYYWGTQIEIPLTIKPGYNFVHWIYPDNGIYSTSQQLSFQMPTTNLDIRAIIEALDVGYVVNYYIMDDDNTSYVIYKTEKLIGETDTQVTPAVYDITHYVSPSSQTVNIEGDESTVVNYYYPKKQYTLKINGAKGVSSVSGAGSYYWGANVNIQAVPLIGYDFIKWENIDTNQDYAYIADLMIKMPTNDLSLNAIFEPYLVPYIVNHYRQKIDGSSYVLYDTDNLEALTDTNLIPVFNTYSGFTLRDIPKEVIINGNGSTVVNYYYLRNIYNVIVDNGTSNKYSYYFGEQGNLVLDESTINATIMFDSWAYDLPVNMSNPWLKKTSFIMPDHDMHFYAIFKPNRLNTNIYKSIFQEYIFDISKLDLLNQDIKSNSNDVIQNNHRFELYDVVCLDEENNLYKKALAEDSIKNNVVGLVSHISGDDIFTLTKYGKINYPETDMQDSSILYLSDKYPGKLVQYQDIENTVYIPIAIYTDHSIVLNILQGSIGDTLIPYEENTKDDFEPYQKSDLDDIINTVINSVKK